MSHNPARNTSIAVFFLVFGALPAALAATPSGWPGMRGPTHDGAVRDASLVTSGANISLKIGWNRDLGSGYSVVAAADGRVIAMFSSGDGDFVAAFKNDSGDELWRYRIEEIYKGHDGSHDGPIASPLVHAGRVYGFSPRGNLFAVDATTGKALWSKDLVAGMGAKSPFYGFTSSPIMVDGVLVVQTGAGEGKEISGFKPEDGALLWSVGDESINYQTPIAAAIGGKLQVIAAGGKTLRGIDAATGKLLWSYEHKGDESVMGGQKLIPVPAGDNRLLLVNKEDSSTMVRVTPDGTSYKVEELWSKNSIRGTYVIPVYHDGHIYGVSGFILTCIDAATGEPKWKSRQPGDGFITLVGKHLVILTKQGTLHVAEASPAAYTELARVDLFEPEKPAWSAVAYADGHLFARSMARLARVDVVSAARPAAVTTADAWIQQTGFGRFLTEASKSPDKKAAIDKYLAGQKAYPIVEDDTVHFIYRGKATDVAIVGDMLGDRREDPMTRFGDTDLFHYSIKLDRNAAVTYGYIVDYEKAAADPLNSRKATGVFGDVSLLAMPGWRQTEIAAAPKSSQGRIETFEFVSKVGGKEKKRTAEIYLPAGYDTAKDKRYPTVYIHDGKDALEKGELKNVLDGLIGAKAEPVIAVFVVPDPENPQMEFWVVDPYVQMISTELVPAIDGKYRTVAEAKARGSIGAGGGASQALSCVLKHPEQFGRLGSQSAFVIGRADYEKKIPPADKQPMMVYMKWGLYDMRSTRESWDTAKGNRELFELVRERGHKVSGGESPEGTGWSFWRGHAGEMIASLYPAGGAK